MSLTGVFLVCTVIPLLFGLWAQFKVKSTFKRYSQVPVASGMTGAQAAEAVLRNSGVSGVGIRPVEGQLSDHYDPRSKTLNLSSDVGMEASVAALGVAAHEAGHAVQDARGYKPMQIRSTLVPAASFGSQVWIFPAFLGLILGSTGLVNVGLVLFLAVVIFQLVTLPVEFDASHRARGRRSARRRGALGGPQGAAGRGPHLRRRARRLDRSADLLLHRLAAVMLRPLGGQ